MDALRRAPAVGGHSRFIALLTTCQVALALALVVSGAAVVGTLQRLSQVGLGFVNERAVALEVTLPRLHYSKPGASDRFIDEVERLIGSARGVLHVGITDAIPGGVRSSSLIPLTLDEAPIPPGHERSPSAELLGATPGYFKAAGIPIIAGRPFTAEDRRGRESVVILSDTAARILNMDPNRVVGRLLPMGQQLWGGAQSGPRSYANIVGVVAATRLHGLAGEAPRQVYRPMAQMPGGNGTVGIVVDGGPDSRAAVLAARRALSQLDPDLPPYNVARLGDLRRRFCRSERLTAIAAILFSTTALLVSGVGVYAALAQRVAHRRREMGLRLALGAEPKDLLEDVLLWSLRITLAGVAVGIALAAGAHRVLTRLVPTLEPPTASTFLFSCLALCVVTTAAAWLPARHAADTDPVEWLRSD